MAPFANGKGKIFAGALEMPVGVGSWYAYFVVSGSEPFLVDIPLYLIVSVRRHVAAQTSCV
jgi:hypothetical protein